jgi:uncharacterized membrane protein YeaQ/YmgE (transglycosylase-associated protein family)
MLDVSFSQKSYTELRFTNKDKGRNKMEADLGQMGWLAWLVVGAVAGWLGSLVMKTNRQQGLLQDILIGIVGAFVGGFLFRALGSAGVTGFNLWSVFVAFVGAVALLMVIRLLNRSGILPN